MRKLVTAIVLLVALVGQGAAYVSAAEPTAQEVAEATAFRTSFGLEARPSLVRDIIQDRDASLEFGSPLTGAEVREMQRRLRINDDVDDVARFVSSYPQELGGLCIDQEARGEVVLQLTPQGQAANSVKARVRELLPEDVTLRIEEVSNSEASLAALQKRVDTDLPKLSDLGIDVRLTGVDLPSNTLIVGVQGLTPDDEDYLRATYGEALTIREDAGGVPGACTRTDCSGDRLRGGLKIWNDVGESCTSAFVGRSRGDLTLTPFLLTVGHCAYPFSSRANQYHPSTTPIGTVSRQAYRDGGYADAAALRISSSRVSNYVWRYSDVTTYPITGIEGNVYQTVGETVIKSGARTGVSTGQITHRFLTISYGSIDISGITQAAMTSNAGDSGSPIFANYKAYGILSGNPFLPGTTTRDTSKTWYSSIGTALTELNIYLCFNVSCSDYGW